MMIPIKLFNYPLMDNYLYSNLITILPIIALVSIIVLIIITCIYNLNDKFKINKNNFIIILFSYIIRILSIKEMVIYYMFSLSYVVVWYCYFNHL
jgi:hypothetical protein